MRFCDPARLISALRPLVFGLAIAAAAQASFALDAGIPAQSNATTSVGGGAFNLNTFLGANRYDTNSTPVNGQNTVAVNLEAGHIWNGDETLQHVTTFSNSAGTGGGGSVAPVYDASRRDVRKTAHP
ncbi:MAG: hypothetical protein JHC52_04080 [Chthoniobacterales bacterium]|nr:hypothetical protein [Chthoniobacterales bacterium]